MNEHPARQDLELIRRLMASNRRLVVGTWRHQVWWGGLTAVGMAATWWAETQGAWGAIGILWLVLIPAGWVGSWAMGRREPSLPVRNPATRSFTGIWIGAGVTLSLLGTVGIAGGGIAPTALPGVAAAVFGAAYLALARATGLAWLRWVAVAWWGAALPLVVRPGAWSYLAFALLLVALQTGTAIALSREEVGEPALGPAGAAS